MDWGFRWIGGFCKFVAPVLVIVYLAVPIYGTLRPWDVADAKLTHYIGEHPIMVGFLVRHREDYVAHRITDMHSRSYILFPSVLREPKTVTVSQTNGQEPIVSVSSYGFLVHAAWFAVAITLTYWFWFRRQSRRHA